MKIDGYENTSKKMYSKVDQLTEVVYKTTVYVDYSQKFIPESKNRGTTKFLYFSALSSNLVQFTYGMMLAWISPISEKLLSDDSQMNPLVQPITTLQLSFIGAAQSTGSFIGPMIFAKLFDILGRKKCLTALYLVMTISLITLAYSSHLIVYGIMLFIFGICMGGVSVGQPVYISEITEDHNRGTMSCLATVGSPLGTVLCFLIGPCLSFEKFTLVCAFPVALNALCFLVVVPESPVYLIKIFDFQGAKAILQKLRDKNSKEIEEDITSIEQELLQTTSSAGGCSSILTEKSSRNGLIIALGSYILLVIGGVPALTAYLQPIFDKAGTSISSNVCALMVAIVQIFCYIAASIGVERWGRRKIMLFSVSSSIIPLFVTGLYFYFKQIGFKIVDEYNWFPVFGIIVFTALNVFGTATIPLAIMNEIFTNQVKATASSVIVLVANILTALTLFGLPIIMESVGLAWCFWIFASNCIVGSLFVYFFVPETKGKTLLEIQEKLKHLTR